MIDLNDPRPQSGSPPHAAAFRLFLLCATVAAVAVMVAWLLGYTKRDPLLTYYGASGWHAHEMLFGYMTAVVAGLLAVVLRDGAGEPLLRGPSLVWLTALWLAGRVLPVMAQVPPWLVAVVDFSFLPALIALLAAPLVKAGRRRELALIAPLAVMVFANVLVHGEWLGLAPGGARLGVVLAIYMLVLMIAILAGRVIPLFVSDGAAPRPVLEYAVAGSVLILAIADLFAPTVQAVVVCALLAAAVHGWRWAGWLRGLRGDPLGWVLMAGYAWLVAGFVLLALSYAGHLRHMLAFHALMVGGFGGLTLGITARMIGGGAVRTPPLAVTAFALLNLAAVLRVAGPVLTARFSQAVIIAAGALWIISFGMFLLVYAPRLLWARNP